MKRDKRVQKTNLSAVCCALILNFKISCAAHLCKIYQFEGIHEISPKKWKI